MDPDVFPNSLEYLGPDRHGVLPQRAGPLDADQSETTHLTLALERPGASGDQGVYADRIELQNIKARFPVPDFSRRVPHEREVGLRPRSPACCAQIKWDDVLDDQFDLSGSATGWGMNFSSNLKSGENDSPAAAVRVSARASRTT